MSGKELFFFENGKTQEPSIRALYNDYPHIHSPTREQSYTLHTHVLTNTHTHIHKHTHPNTYTNPIPTYPYIHTPTKPQTHTSPYPHIHISHTYIPIHSYAHIVTFPHTHMPTYLQTDTHTYPYFHMSKHPHIHILTQKHTIITLQSRVFVVLLLLIALFSIYKCKYQKNFSIRNKWRKIYYIRLMYSHH